MDKKFQKLKRKIEAKSGPMSPTDEIEVKGLFYFAKGVQLKNQLEPGRRSRVFGAIKDYYQAKKEKRKTKK